MGLFGGRKAVFVDADILVIGGGMAGCGATYANGSRSNLPAPADKPETFGSARERAQHY